MNWEFLGNLGSLLQGITGVLTLVTIVYVLQQTKEMTKQSRLSATATMASLYENIISKMLDIDKIFFDDPGMKPYFYKNQKIDENDPNYDKAMSLAELLVDFMDLVVVLEKEAEKQTGPTDIPWADWKSYFKDIYNTSPIIRTYWSERGHWYTNTLADILNR